MRRSRWVRVLRRPRVSLQGRRGNSRERSALSDPQLIFEGSNRQSSSQGGESSHGYHCGREGYSEQQRRRGLRWTGGGRPRETAWTGLVQGRSAPA